MIKWTILILRPSLRFYTKTLDRFLLRIVTFGPCGLRRGSATARLRGLQVRIPPGAWIFVCCECCVLSGRGFGDKLITRPEESYRLWYVWVWSRNLKNEEAMTHCGSQCHRKKKNYLPTTKFPRVWAAMTSIFSLIYQAFLLFLLRIGRRFS